MKDELYKKMEQWFPLIEHRYRDAGPLEMTIWRLARGNTFNMRVVGLGAIKRFRRENPDCAITFKPNHLSEADFMLLSLLFQEHGVRVLTEGGSNLFIEQIDLFKDLFPLFVDPGFKDILRDQRMSVAEYLSARGAFKVFREPEALTLPDGTEVNLGKKEILTLSRAYRNHLVRNKEMYVTFPGYSSVKSGFMDLIKKDDIKTGRSYTGQFDGFHHLPFQMDIEAVLATGIDVFVVDVNMGYSPVLEDENFMELLRMKAAGASKGKIYLKDLGYIISSFCRDKRKGELSIKFGSPVKVDTSQLKEPFLGRKIKNAAQTLAQSTFAKSLAMQPVFPANIYFSAFDTDFNRISISHMRERIDDIRDHLRHMGWGQEKYRVDLHYVLDYRNHIYSADEIINRTFDLFNYGDRQITSRDGNMLVVYNKHVATQYRNHIAHFLEGMKARSEIQE
jgi:glycerol-3-phosphate O-acyltransferase